MRSELWIYDPTEKVSDTGGFQSCGEVIRWGCGSIRQRKRPHNPGGLAWRHGRLFCLTSICDWLLTRVTPVCLRKTTLLTRHSPTSWTVSGRKTEMKQPGCFCVMFVVSFFFFLLACRDDGVSGDISVLYSTGALKQQRTKFSWMCFELVFKRRVQTF